MGTGCPLLSTLPYSFEGKSATPHYYFQENMILLCLIGCDPCSVWLFTPKILQLLGALGLGDMAFSGEFHDFCTLVFRGSPLGFPFYLNVSLGVPCPAGFGFEGSSQSCVGCQQG